MSAELAIANVVRQIIVKAWTDEDFKKRILEESNKGNARELLERLGFEFPKYNGYTMYPTIKVVECKPGDISYIVLPPDPTNQKASREQNDLTDLAVVAARGNTVLGI